MWSKLSRFPQKLEAEWQLQMTYISELYGGFLKNGGTQQPWVFLLKMIILRWFGGTTI